MSLSDPNVLFSPTSYPELHKARSTYSKMVSHRSLCSGQDIWRGEPMTAGVERFSQSRMNTHKVDKRLD